MNNKLLEHLAKHVKLTFVTCIILLIGLSSILTGTLPMALGIVGILWLMSELKDINRRKRKRKR